MTTAQIEHIMTRPQKIQDMTTVIAIKSIDGIVIASDSQSTSMPYAKNLEVSKIFKINNSIGIGTAGDENNIKILVESLKQNLGQEEFDSEPILRKKIDDILINLHRTHNVIRSIEMGYQNPVYLFNPIALIGAKLLDGSFCLYLIAFRQYGPLGPYIDLVDNYQSIGSGFALANLVLTQQSRIPKIDNNELSNLPLNYNKWIAAYVINAVKAVEPYTGGNTNVVLIDKNGFNLIPDKEQQDFYNHMVSYISNEYRKRLFDNGEVKDLSKIFPRI